MATKFGFSRSVKTKQLGARIMGFKVDGTGTASITQGSTDATLTDNGTGNYTLTWAEPFSRPPVVVATTLTDVTTIRIATAATNLAVVFECVAADQTTPADAEFDVLVMGYDKEDEV